MYLSFCCWASSFLLYSRTLCRADPRPRFFWVSHVHCLFPSIFVNQVHLNLNYPCSHQSSCPAACQLWGWGITVWYLVLLAKKMGLFRLLFVFNKIYLYNPPWTMTLHPGFAFISLRCRMLTTGLLMSNDQRGAGANGSYEREPGFASERPNQHL